MSLKGKEHNAIVAKYTKQNIINGFIAVGSLFISLDSKYRYIIIDIGMAIIPPNEVVV